MIRQRVHLRSARVADTALKLLVSLLACAAIFYGAMVVLAAVKVSPHTINEISAYRTIDDTLTSIDADTITDRDRIIVAVAGVLCLLVFAPLAWRALPRPYLGRTGVALEDRSEPGHTEIAPRAVERAGELAARDHPLVADAAARYDTGTVDVRLDLELSDDDDLIATLHAVQRRVRDRLGEHGVPGARVDVTFAELSSSTTRRTT
jgi:hypothetical protein